MKRKWLACLLALLMLFVTACSGGGATTESSSEGSGTGSAQSGGNDGETNAGGGSEASEIDPYGPFAETVVINIAQQVPPGDPQIPDGQTIEDNVMTRFYEEALNIKFEREWNATSGEPYDQKVMLAIASRDIPDAMKVNEEQLRMLVQADLIQDLTDVWEQYASPNLKKFHDMANNEALDYASFNGKLYGIPNISIKGDAITQLYVRQDWLEELNLPEPRTIDDIEMIAQAFIDSGKATIGMTGPNTPELANEKGNRTHGFDAIFASYHSFPRHWLYDENGEVTYGSIQPQTKEALAKLRDLYVKGLIDREFFMRDNPDELFLSGQAGIVFGPWWMAWGGFGRMFEQFPDATWKAYAAPVDKDGNFVTHLQAISREFLVVRKDYEHPEALIKGVNLKIGIDRQAHDELPPGLYDRYREEVVPTSISNTLDIFRVVTDDVNLVATIRQKMLDALDGKIDPEELGPEFKTHFDIGSKYLDDREVYKYYPQGVEDGYTVSQLGAIQAYLIGGKPNTEVDIEVGSLLYSPTETMRSRWANLTKLEDETFLRIVIGETSLDQFDSFVEEWRKLGGDQIIQEVAEIVANE